MTDCYAWCKSLYILLTPTTCIAPRHKPYKLRQYDTEKCCLVSRMANYCPHYIKNHSTNTNAGYYNGTGGSANSTMLI